MPCFVRKRVIVYYFCHTLKMCKCGKLDKSEYLFQISHKCIRRQYTLVWSKLDHSTWASIPSTFLRRTLDVCSVTRMVRPLADISRKESCINVLFESTAVASDSVCISSIGTGMIPSSTASLGIESRQAFLTCAKR